MKCQATTYSHNLCPIFTDIARVLMYSFRDQLQPVLTVFLRFFAVPVHSSCILKLSGTRPVRGPSKKGNRIETGPDFKALDLISGKVRSESGESAGMWQILADYTGLDLPIWPV